ncbi:MAG: hypothetical protein JXA11_02270 [Phycisphaerae bacterium]|nr:hypothetical protein [Phycisphaerae bacterium]
MRCLLLLCLLGPCLGGCGGYYILTVPDQVAGAKGDLVPVIRLQRNDFFFLALAARRQAMRFRIYPTPDTLPGAEGEGPLRSAFTDKTGYAGVHFSMSEPPVRGKAGLYYMKVALQDIEGAELSAAVPLFVWDPDKPVVAVDYDCLPAGFLGQDDAVVAALRNIAETANIVYLTRASRRTQEDAHRRIAEIGIPDGPVLLWQRKRWHIVRDGKYNLPRIVIESRLEGQLPKLVKEFPKMRYGICNSELAAKAFVDAGIQCVVVGNTWMTGSRLIHRDSWDHLAREGLPKP